MKAFGKLKKLFDWWPFVLKSSYEQMRRENWELRNALRGRNEEVRKHRVLIGGLRNGSIDIVGQVMRKVD